jgi:hypothetical protein
VYMHETTIGCVVLQQIAATIRIGADYARRSSRRTRSASFSPTAWVRPRTRFTTSRESVTDLTSGLNGAI